MVEMTPEQERRLRYLDKDIKNSRRLLEIRTDPINTKFLNMCIDFRTADIKQLVQEIKAGTVATPSAVKLPEEQNMTSKLAWSWSRLECFELCPRKFHHMNILKDVPFVTNEAMDRGKKIHKHLEDAIKYDTPLPSILDHMVPIVNQLKSIPGAEITAEEKLAFTESMKPTGYFAKDVWLRVVMDLRIKIEAQRTANIFDWKTGKVKPYSDQLAVNAMAGLALWDDVDIINTSYLFVDHKKRTSATFTRDQYDGLLRKFGDRSEMIQLTLESGIWKPTPNQFCGRCPLTPAQCEYRR